MKQKPLQRAKQWIQREQSIRQIEARPHARPQQDAPHDFEAIGKAATQSELVTLQLPASGLVLCRLKVVRQMLCASVIQNPSRFAAARLQLHGGGERVRVQEPNLLREPQRGSHLGQNAIRARLIRERTSLLCRKTAPERCDIDERFEPGPSIERSVDAEMEKAPVQRQNVKADFSETHLLAGCGRIR